MKSGKLRIVGILLLGSLALNLFLGGLFVGYYLNQRTQQHATYPRPMMMKFRRLVQSLPAESQAKILPLLQVHYQRVKPQIHQVQRAQQVVYEQINAPNFNAEALSAALAKLRQEMTQAQQLMHADLVNLISQLNENERRHLSKVIQSHRRHRHAYPQNLN